MKENVFLPDSPITSLGRVTKEQEAALKRLGILTISDLLYHFPVRHIDAGKSSPIEFAEEGERATLYGQVEKTGTKKSFRSKVPMGEATMRDQSGRVKLVWFNQAYMAKMIAVGDIVRASGVVKKTGGTVTLINPEVEKVPALPTDLSPSLFSEGGIEIDQRFFPVYSESKGVSSAWLYHKIQKVLASGILDTLVDPIPAEILKRYNLPSLTTALIWIHTPRDEKHALSARKRFAFEEIFFIQLERQQSRFLYEQNPTFTITPDKKEVAEFIEQFGFPLTPAQGRAITTIFEDFGSARPMLRLLEGDVGSGKTAVAATTTYATIATRPLGQNFGTLQVAYMCPTEILATQHFESFINYFVGTGIQIGLITGSGCRKFPSKVDPSGWTDISRTQFLKWVASGEIAIVIGTHALIQKSVQFKHLAYVIIDEQHRFGTKQRQALLRKLNADYTQTNADEPPQPIDNFLYKDMSYAIRGLLFEVKRELGLGHKEIVYQNAFAIALAQRGIAFEREKQIAVHYHNKKVGVYQPDFIIDGKMLIEFKALPFLGKNEEKQLWTYLKGSDYRVGFLVNFGGGDLEIKRVVYDTARTQGLRESASSLLKSAVCAPHMLSMTATPIPRTLALTLYGDLDLTLLDQMPTGRKPIITDIVPIGIEKRDAVYEKIREALKEGRQAYVICPRIDAPDETKEMALQAKSVKEEAKRLKEKVFKEYTIDILHSKMKPSEKDAVMEKFASGETHILVATSVVEVGVNVPNATQIIIEGAERFGLAQLHQLRGRVIRSNHQAHCYLFSETNSEKTFARLKAMTTAKNGFELSEIDLTLRGSGELGGGKQWGITDIGMEAIKNIKMVEAAREEAKRILTEDLLLAHHPTLKEKLAQTKISHFE